MVSFLDILAKNRELEAPHVGAGFERTVQSIPGMMERWVHTWPKGHQDKDVIRCSGLHRLCPREFVLNYWRPTPSTHFDFSSHMRMGVGTFLHEFLQDVVLACSGVLEGSWLDEKGDKHVGYIPDPEKQLFAFIRQQPLPFKYVENRVWDEHFRLRGHLDGVLNKARLEHFRELDFKTMSWEESLLSIFKVSPGVAKANLEIKTTSTRVLQNTNKVEDIPPYYIMQAVAYQKLTGIHETVFWYFERNELSSKTILHTFSESWWEEIERKINIIWTAIRDHTLPDSMMKCVSCKDARAAQCVHSKVCWNPPIGSSDMEKFISECKDAQPTRKWLDLSEWKAL